KEVMLQTATEMSRDPQWRKQILDKPEIWGIETISAREVVVRLVLKVSPAVRFSGARELRLRLKHALDHAGLSLALSNAMVITGDNPPSGLKAALLEDSDQDNTQSTAEDGDSAGSKDSRSVQTDKTAKTGKTDTAG